MVDGLAAIRTGVNDEAIALGEALPLSQLRGSGDQMTEECAVLCSGVRGRSEMLLRDDEYVRWRLRMDVGEGQRKAVFVEPLCGDRAGNDLAEETRFRHTIGFSLAHGHILCG